MTNVEVILSLLVAMIFLVALANRLRIPYPILLVLGGLAIGFVPVLPRIEIDPDLVFVLFLPPIIQLSSYNTPMRDFQANFRSIMLLSIGLVLATTGVIGVVAHFFIPGMSWPVAFVLGAIVAPPDAIAASTIARRLRLPRRLVTVLEGESLLNDATSLVAYRVGIVAILTGTFSFLDAGSRFLLAASGGVTIGLLVGFVLTPLFRRLVRDISVYLVLTFLSGFGAYLLAEALHASGVLAVVALGLFYNNPHYNTMTPELRIQGIAIWEIVVFVLNGLIFILIGLELRNLVEQLSNFSIRDLIFYVVLINATLIVVRFIWVFPGTYLPRMLPGIREKDPFPPWQHTVIVGWTGMRGIVSLASALALPLVAANRQPFPQRDLIIFLTFSVILFTLIIQGLTLPLLIRWLKVVDDNGGEREEQKARLKVAMAGQKRLQELAEEQQISPALMEKLKHQYDARVRLFSGRYKGELDGDQEDLFSSRSQVELDLLAAETEALVRLRDEKIINDEILHRVQRDLDLEWLRLQNA